MCVECVGHVIATWHQCGVASMLPGRPSDMSTLAWQPPGCGAMLCRLGLCEWMRSGTLEGVFEHLYSPWASSHPACASVAQCVCVECVGHVIATWHQCGVASMLPGRPSDMSTLAWQPPGCGAMLCRLGLCEWMRSGTLEGVFEHLYSPWASSHPACASVAQCVC